MTKNLAEEAGPRILVVDDDPSIRMLTRACLEQEGFNVSEAENGAAALDVFAAEGADLILMDVLMPAMDGYEACASIRLMPGGQFVPILMVTGLEDVSSIATAYQSGATDFVTKPISWALLPHRVRYMLRAAQAFSQLHSSQSKNIALLNAMPDMVFRIDGAGVVLECNGANDFELRAEPDWFIGKFLGEVVPPDVEVESLKHLRKALDEGGTHRFEYKMMIKRKEHEYEARVSRSGANEVIAVVRDITERRRNENQIRFLAYFDGLTKLPNRVLFQDRLAQVLARAERNEEIFALMFVDLDGFKRVNDTLGHHVGDLLLKEVARRMQDCLRGEDSVARLESDDDLPVARMGGDEFSALVTELRSADDASRVAMRIVDSVSEPFNLEGNEVFVSPSIGIAMYPGDGGDAGALLKHADAAMYHAKSLGGKGFQYYSRSMSESAVRRLTLESRLRGALKHEELVLHYQPQISLSENKLIGVEALVRWNNNELGLVSPAQFLPLAEEIGVMHQIENWVIERACADTSAWQHKNGEGVRVSVNLSGVQFRTADQLLENVKSAANRVNLNPQLLELELTENIIMDDTTSAIRLMRDLKNIGIRLAIDDFGTGYSSLSYVKSFPLDVLKIDKSFVDGLPDDKEDWAICSAIVAMGHSLGLEIVAEGVEKQEQQQVLSELGCDALQGFFFSRPLPLASFEALLEKGLVQSGIARKV